MMVRHYEISDAQRGRDLERIRKTHAVNRFWLGVEPYITGALMGIAGVMMLLALIAWVSQGGQ